MWWVLRGGRSPSLNPHLWRATSASAGGRSMKQLDLIIRNKTGLHARPARVFVDIAKQFQSTIRIGHGEKLVNAKSMISVLTLGVGSGQHILIDVDGADEAAAVAALEAAVWSGLGEEPV